MRFQRPGGDRAGDPWPRTVALPPVVVGERSFRLMARFDGWRGPARGGGGAWLRLAPVAVVLREPDGRERRLALPDGTRDAVRGIAAAGLLVAAACWAIRWTLR